MLQKEVVLRMTAPVGDKNYNRLSVMTQYYCHNSLLFEIKPQAFFPPPKVDSAVVRMTPHQPEVIAKDEKLLSDVVRTTFLHRRKTVHNNLKSLLDQQDYDQLAIDPKLRPQQLSVNNFVMISNLLYDKAIKGD